MESISLAFKQALIERTSGAQLPHHQGCRPGADKPELGSNHRHGVNAEMVLTGNGPVRIEVPRDREGSFAPLLIAKHERRFNGFDDKIVTLKPRGMTVREIQAWCTRAKSGASWWLARGTAWRYSRAFGASPLRVLAISRSTPAARAGDTYLPTALLKLLSVRSTAL